MPEKSLEKVALDGGFCLQMRRQRFHSENDRGLTTVDLLMRADTLLQCWPSATHELSHYWTSESKVVINHNDLVVRLIRTAR